MSVSWQLLALPLTEALVMGLLAGLVGALALLDRRIFLTESLTHSTFPGAVAGVTYGGASSVVPTAGTYDYSQLRAFVKKNLYATDITKENANVVVLNATGVSGVAQKQAWDITNL